MEKLREAMGGDYPVVDNRGGPKHTVFSDQNFRYDREKPCQSYGHPRDQFFNYSIQGNFQSSNEFVSNLAQQGNGRYKAPQEPGVLGGGNFASCNMQQTGQITPPRAWFAQNNSAYHQEPRFVATRADNMNYIPGNIRQAGGIYPDNPFKAWPGREDPQNPYYGCGINGELPPESRMYDQARWGGRRYDYHNTRWY